MNRSLKVIEDKIVSYISEDAQIDMNSVLIQLIRKSFKNLREKPIILKTNDAMMRINNNVKLSESARSVCRSCRLYKELAECVDRYGAFMTYHNLRAVLFDLDEKGDK